MRTGEAEVKSEKVVVGQATFNIYDSISEAVETEGEEKILKLVNAQNKTDAMNATRSAATSKPTKARLQEEVMANLTQEEVLQYIGDGAGMKAFLEKKVDELAEEYESRRLSNVASGDDENED